MSRIPLSQQRILDRAAALMRQHGAEALSVRALASELGVTPMAIYRHFEDKDALLAALVDRFIDNARLLPARELPWDQWLRHVGRAMHRYLVAAPDTIWLLKNLRFTAQGMGIVASCVDVMGRAGFSADAALEAFYAMVHASIGSAVLDVAFARQDLNSPIEAPPAALAALPKRLRSPGAIARAHDIEKNLNLLIKALRAQRR